MRVAVIGAGVGGLSAAIHLATAGAEVTVFESAEAVGGKMRTVRVGDADIDAGPTVLTMPWVFDELFDGRLAEYVPTKKLETIARHYWGGATLELFADRQRSADAIADFAGTRERDGYLRFCAYAERIFVESRESFLESHRPTMASLIRESGLSALTRTKAIDPFRTMAKALRDFFVDPRLLQLFGRYATYAGSSPFEAPATLCSIAHVESEGVMRVRGGMHALARGIAKRAAELGVVVHTGRRVERVLARNGRVHGIVAAGDEHSADVVVMNGEASALADGLLGTDVRKAGMTPRERSLSAVTFCTDESVPGLTHHNVFFSEDSAREFEILKKRVPDDPTVYVCAQDRGLLVLVNAPAGLQERDTEGWRKAVLRRLAMSGMTVTLERSVMTAPADFARLFPGSAGALYGAASHGWKAFFDRPAARTTCRGLYLAGGSVHPGAGVPMVAISGRLAAQAAIADFGSTSMSMRMATRGGTSTQRVTMARMR